MTPFRYSYPIEVRYSDLDPQGHVNHARYFSFIEQARVGYLKHLGLWNGKSFLDIGIIIAEAQVSYKAPIHFGKIVQVGVHISRLGTKSMTMLYRFQDDQSEFEYATGSTVLVAYDYRNTRTIPITDEWRKKISDFEGISQYAEG
jgi:acyl-CoA thioester hydrolase